MSSGIQCFVKRFRGRRERRVKRKGMKERDWKRRRRGSGENSRKSRRVSQEGKVEILWAHQTLCIKILRILIARKG